MSVPVFPLVSSPASGGGTPVVPSPQFPVVTSPESTLPVVQVPVVNQSAYDLGLGSGNPHAVDHARYADQAPYSGLINPPVFGSAAFHDVAANGNATASQVVLGSDTRLQGTGGVGGNYLAANDPSVTNARVPLSHAVSHGVNGTDPISITRAQISDLPAVSPSDWNTLANKPAVFPPDATAELVVRKGQAGGYAGLDGTGKVPSLQLPAGQGGTPDWNTLANKPSTFPPDATAELVARKGQASGYAGLGVDGKVPSGQLPPIASDWNTLSNKPTTFSPALHAASHGNGAADAVSIVKAQVSDFPALGTASSRDVPASGDAGNTQAVLGADSRLAQVATNSAAITTIQGDSRWTNARTPTAHASTHVGGSDAIAQASSVLVGLCPMVDNITIQVVASKLTTVALAWTAVTGKPTTFSPAAHAASHGNGQADAVTLTRAQISDFPTLGTASPLDVASSGNAAAGQVVKGDDGRLSDSRTPVAHQASHVGGSDAIPVATSLITGLCPVLDNATIVVTASKLAVGAVPNASVTGLGNAALLTSPGTGVNATSGQLVKGDDTRLTNARTASAHAASHASGGGDAVTLVKAQISDFPTLGTSSVKDIPASGNASVGQVVYGTDTRLTDSRTPAAHAASHGNGAGDAITVANTQVTGLGTSSTVNVPASGNAANGEVVKGNDTRLSDSRTPLGHAASHKAAGGDAIKLDELAAPTDVTTLNASASAHGLLPKLSNVSTQFLNGVGGYSTPAGAGDMAKATYDTANRGYVDRAVLADSASAVAYANVTGTPTLGTSAAKNIPASGNAAVGEVVYGTDTRLTDARSATAHAASHITGGGDVIASASATVAGLVPTPPNNTNKWYLGNSSWAYQAQSTETNGTFTVPAAGSTVTVTIQSAAWPIVGQTLLITDGTRIGFFEITTVSSATSLIVANRGYLGNSVSGTMATGSTVRLMGPGLATATQPGFVPVPPNDATKVLTGAMTYAAVAYANVTGTPTLGTSAAKDIPASGDASTGQVVYGTDTRLTNSRAPTAHQASHVGGADAIPVATSLITGLCPILDNATIVVTSTKLAVGAVPNASVTGLGNAALLTAPGTAVNASSGQLVKGDDTRLTDSRTPAAHAASHKSAGGDALKLDEFAATTDVTTLNSSTTAHGLLAKLSNVASQYMDGTGAWSTPPAGSSAITTTNGSFTCPAAGATVSVTFTSTTGFAAGMGLYISGAGLFNVSSVTDGTHAMVLNLGVTGNALSGTIATAKNVWLAGVATVATATVPGYVPTPSNVATQFLNGQMGYTAPVLDLLGAPTDVTTLNASTTSHGLLKKLSNVATQYMDGTGLWSVPAGSSVPPKPFKTWIVGLEGSPTSTLYATFGVQNNRPHLAFNDSATWSTLLFGVVPTGAVLTGGFIVRLNWKSIVTTPSGNARWGVALERMNTAQNADSLDTQALATTAVGAQHVLVESAITITTIDSMVAGDKFMLQIQRIGGDAADTLTGDANLVIASMETVN